jgi:hypothetical protein
MNQSHFGGVGSLCLIIETCLSLVFNVQAKQTSATTLMQSAGYRPSSSPRSKPLRPWSTGRPGLGDWRVL